jgi:hypothetical protein
MDDQGSEERSRAMLIIGCDFHTRYQQIAMVDQATGELVERRLEHESGEAQAFYRSLPKPMRVGIEATSDREEGSFGLLKGKAQSSGWRSRQRTAGRPLRIARRDPSAD